jgi:hypothetical protein
VKTLKEFHDEQMKDWRYRFWWYVYTPKYWLIEPMIRFRAWWRKRR